MKILVTGASGFIGTQLMKYLKEKKHIVHGISRTSNTRNITAISLSNLPKLGRIFEKNRYDVVVHLAATTYNENLMDIFRNNCKSTFDLLDICRKNNVSKVIFASTHTVYGNSKYLPINEDHPLNPATNYAISKIIGESICKMFFNSFGLNTTILRISSVYGKGQPPSLVIPMMIKNMLENKKLVLHKYRNGFQIMDLINVDDVCKAIELAARKDTGFKTYNIASGTPITVENIAKELSKISNCSIEIKNIPRETNHFLYDISLAKKQLGFKPTIKLNKNTLSEFMKNIN
jgi:UDP-glucose 4-epimerase